nr:hypothetical protein [Hymenobacter guriensis]
MHDEPGRRAAHHQGAAQGLADQGLFINIELLLGPFEAGPQGTHFRGTGHFFTAHFGHELGLLPAVKQLGADAQLPRDRLRAAALAGQAQGLGLERLVVLALFVG